MTLAEGIQAFLALLVGGDILATLVTNAKLGALSTKLDGVQSELRTALNQLGEHSIELARLGAKYEALEERYRDLAGFLQSLGFKKRDGP